MKKSKFVLPIFVFSLLLSACGASVDLDTPKSIELKQEYDYYQDSVNTIRSTMKTTPEESDEIFIILTSSCGIEEKITQIYKNGSADDIHYTVWYGLSNIDVYLDDNTVSKVLKSNAEIYPTLSAAESTESLDKDSSDEILSTGANIVYTSDLDSLKQLFTDTLSVKCDNLAVSYDDINACFSVSYLPTGDTWNETTFVQKCFSDYISYCKESYVIDGVTNIQFIISTNLEDSYGNIERKEVVQFRMNKDNFDKYDFDNLEYENIYDSFSSGCEFFWIHPGILDKIKTDKIIYTP